METLLRGAAILVLLMTLCGLWRVMLAGAAADWIMGVQLLGTGAIAALLLLAASEAMPALLDLALMLALLAAFAVVAFVLGEQERPAGDVPDAAPGSGPGDAMGHGGAPARAMPAREG
ncbi:monovalent cation/H+ antiporter complex subunit F [Roseomonas sp. NAR14]|uniref:Monovalent cation/H+ antiporter complex subunit F n=1 Tax=Roseomonas acroporae TaxID=2937791 RepID=A0A9X1YCL8_9PROT|nr:monovalent cation/H+ antiporter complex subunit F [Roseomonas acroporae]MCK8786242.1 monovalent cation/H+ antiporter complex subunit F [Roseomonas acroporae]